MIEIFVGAWVGVVVAVLVFAPGSIVDYFRDFRDGLRAAWRLLDDLGLRWPWSP